MTIPGIFYMRILFIHFFRRSEILSHKTCLTPKPYLFFNTMNHSTQLLTLNGNYLYHLL
jgi:hypothetical protein